MQELLEKYKISHLETSDGRIYMMHEEVLKELASEYHKKQLSICDVRRTFDSLIERLIQLNKIKYPNRNINKDYRDSMVEAWKYQRKLLQKKVEELEKELNCV